MQYEVTVPESLDDITLEQYQKFLLIEEPTTDDLLTIFLNESLEVVESIKASEIDKLTIHINSLFEEKPKHRLKFNLNGVPYGFIPDIDNISYGENKDVTTNINDWQKMHKAMAVLYRPITLNKGGKYLIEDYKGTRLTENKMKHMPLSVVMGSLFFFLNLTDVLLKSIPNYLQNQMQHMNKKSLAENGEAIQKYIHLLEVTLKDLNTLQRYPYINV